jgi:hypothetical protein
MLAIWKFSCNSFFKVSSNSSTYLSFPFVKLRIKEFKCCLKISAKVKNLGRFKGGTVKVRPLTVLTGENGTGKSFFTKTLYSVFSIVNKNLLYIDATDNIQVSGAIIDDFDQSLTRKGEEDKKISCNSFFKVSSNSSTYLSFPFVKLRIKESKYFLKKSAG